MGKRNRLTLCAILISISFLGSTFTPINAYDIDWVIGEPYLFGLQFYEYYEDRDISNGNYDIDQYQSSFELSFNITRIDLESKVLDMTYYYPDGTLDYWNNYDFDMAFYSEYLFSHTNDFFDIDFIWDTETESVVLYDFGIDFWFDPLFFVEPIWIDFNQALKGVFNGSTIVDIVDVPDTEIDIEVTFSYFLDIAKNYNINNRNSLSNAINQFTDNNTDLLLHFDLSNVIHDYIYDEDLGENVLVPLEEYIIDFEIKYSDGGLLEYYTSKFEVAMTYDDEYFKGIEEYTYAYGGLKRLRNSLNILIIIPALLVSVLIMKFSVKKKKEKVINEL